MNGKDEKAYVQRILDGETELFSIFLERYSRPIYSLIIQMISSHEDAEELVQDVFLKAFRSLNSYRGDSSFSTWLYRIAYNMTISFTRKKKMEYLYIEERMIDNVPDREVDGIFSHCETEDRTNRLIHSIELLNVEEKALITFFYYDEKSMEEIGDILKLSISNVKVKLHRIRKKIYVLMNGG